MPGYLLLREVLFFFSAIFSCYLALFLLWLCLVTKVLNWFGFPVKLVLLTSIVTAIVARWLTNGLPSVRSIALFTLIFLLASGAVFSLLVIFSL